MIYKGDCLVASDKIPSGSVDLILTDLPFGTVHGITDVNHGMAGKTSWDIVIETKAIYKIANRILRKNGKMVLFAQQPFTTELIKKALPSLPHLYNMIWLKDHFANSLIAKKAPVSYFEDIVVFGKKYDHLNLHPLRAYFGDVMRYINLSKAVIIKKIGQRVDHVFRISSTQFHLCSLSSYQALVDTFQIDKMVNFKPFNELTAINATFNATFNLWSGGKYKANVLKYKKDYNGYHPTQKPVLLLEDLIKTYTNQGDLVVDLTMGSGSTGVACQNTGRDFIGIELDDNYFEIAQKRLT